MSGLQFMNQDGEWEKFPTDDVLYEKARQREALNALQVRIICHLCNEPCPSEELAFWIEGQSLTWSCKKCHAVNESKPQI
jgi:RNase P subunit RPR2